MKWEALKLRKKNINDTLVFFKAILEEPISLNAKCCISLLALRNLGLVFEYEFSLNHE